MVLVLIHSLVFVLIEKIHQTLKTTFNRLSTHPKFVQKYSVAHYIFNSLLNETLSIMIDTLQQWLIQALPHLIIYSGIPCHDKPR